MRIFARRHRPERKPLGSIIVFLDRDGSRRPAPNRQQRIDDLRRRLLRIRRDLEACRSEQFLPGKRTRVRAGQLAYMDLLIEASELLGVDHDLHTLRGVDQQLEVLRLEAALGSAGMRLQAA
jgi:hypothetical protein